MPTKISSLLIWYDERVLGGGDGLTIIQKLTVEDTPAPVIDVVCNVKT